MKKIEEFDLYEDVFKWHPKLYKRQKNTIKGIVNTIKSFRKVKADKIKVDPDELLSVEVGFEDFYMNILINEDIPFNIVKIEFLLYKGSFSKIEEIYEEISKLYSFTTKKFRIEPKSTIPYKIEPVYWDYGGEKVYGTRFYWVKDENEKDPKTPIIDIKIFNQTVSIELFKFIDFRWYVNYALKHSHLL